MEVIRYKIVIILFSILLLSCFEQEKENKINTSKHDQNVFYGQQLNNLEDTFSIYSPDLIEHFSSFKRKITFFFENDTLKFNSGLYGGYESIKFDGYILNENMSIKLEFTDCTRLIDSLKLFTSELRFKNSSIKPHDFYTCEFNIHAQLSNEWDSLEVFICGTYTDTIHPSPPKYILDGREWEKQNNELTGR